MQQLLVVTILLLVLAVAWELFRDRPDFVVAVRAGQVHMTGRIPGNKTAEITEFFVREFSDAGRLKVLGSRSAGGQLQLKIRGRLSQPDRQRIRNFMLATLGN